MLRYKESAADYRYFPEPDIPPLSFTAAFIESIAAGVAKLPSEAKEEYINMGLTEAEATLLINTPELQKLFDGVYAAIKDGKRTSSLILTQLPGFLTEQGKTLADAPSLASLIELALTIQKGTISVNAGKDVLEKMIVTKKSSAAIILEEGMGQISDHSKIIELIKKAVAANPKAIEAFKSGKAAALGAIVGAVMKESRGQANPALVQELLQKEIV